MRVRRFGLTLVELLIVISIVGILLALLIPAVLRAREVARRAHCVSNMRQIGVGLHAYQSAFGVFPTLVTNSPQPPAVMFLSTWESQQRYSPHARILSQLGFGDLFNSINFDWPHSCSYRPGNHSVNLTVELQAVSLFLCPSDYNGRVREAGKNSYRYNTGAQCYTSFRNTEGAGAFFVLHWSSPSDFADGLASTAGLAEKISGDLDPDTYDASSDAGLVTITSMKNISTDEFVAACRSQKVYPNLSHSGYSWLSSDQMASWYNHVVPPNHSVGDCSDGGQHLFKLLSPYHPSGVFPPRSNHGPGANVMMMDGSVRFIGRDIDLGLWRALGTSSGRD